MKRLKIVEQIIIVLILAVVIPFVTLGFIISNVSQQSVRQELQNNAVFMAQLIGDALENYISISQSQLDQIASSFNYIDDAMQKLKYFDEIEAKTKLFSDLDIVEKSELPKEKFQTQNQKLILISKIDPSGKYYLKAKIDINIIDFIFGSNNTNGRNIYLFDEKNNPLAVNSANSATNKKDVISDLNVDKLTKKTCFGSKKNTPKAYYRLDNPEGWYIVVDTTKKVTKNTITKARYRIIISLCLAALSIMVIVGFYVFYLYVNIRQLFKGIKAISKGNYDKKIHLIKSVFTPHEIVFLAKEFNYMATKINISYKDLRKKNKTLQKLNEYREDLVNATSHEFRTPLTSIIGYTSRLLRQDIELDEETKVKSLQIIKQQAQRLSKMVEDLLVIPELESSSLKFNIQEVDLADSITRVAEYLTKEEVELKTDIAPDLAFIFADELRLEQILVNLIDNAQKYSLNNEPVEIIARNDQNGTPIVQIKNKCEEINDEIKEKLFDKFIRVDSKLTRTTRGTGLGLYIVKAFAQSMKIDINLETNSEFIITLKFNDHA